MEDMKKWFDAIEDQMARCPYHWSVDNKWYCSIKNMHKCIDPQNPDSAPEDICDMCIDCPELPEPETCSIEEWTWYVKHRYKRKYTRKKIAQRWKDKS